MSLVKKENDRRSLGFATNNLGLYWAVKPLRKMPKGDLNLNETINLRSHLGENKGNLRKLLCLYDGIKLRSYDKKYIKWLKLPEQRKFFDLRPTFTYDGETETRLKGRYLNIEIDISYQGKWVVDFSGSVHKLYNILAGNGGHNHNDFYWFDFLEVYDAMQSIFKFDPYTLHIVNIEAGANLGVPNTLELPISEILVSVLSLLGVCKNIRSIKKSERDSLFFRKGDNYAKAYNKSAQHNLSVQILRLELGYSRARPIIKNVGVKYFADLLQISALVIFKSELIKAIKTLHTCHPNLRQLPTKLIEANREIQEYGQAHFWCKQKRENRYRYTQKRKHQDQLTAEYCNYNISHYILGLLIAKLS